MINKISTLTALTLFAALSIIVAGQTSDAKRVSESELPKPLIASVRSWQRAAQARNVNALVASTWPRADLFCTYWVMEPEGAFVSYSFGFEN